MATYRMTQAHLQALVDRLNRLTGSPAEPYTKGEDGRYHANIGNYHLSSAYGGVNLVRMHNESGGISCPINHGRVPKRELYHLMHAFIRGIETAKGE